MSSEGIFRHFPHPDFRTNQRHIIRRLKQCIRSDDVDFVVFQGPTGTGKTAIAGTAASWTEDAYYLSEQKIHQQQAYTEFPDSMRIVKGRGNYDCGEQRPTPCPRANPHSDEGCPGVPSAEANGMYAGHSDENGDLYWKRGAEFKCPYSQAKMRALGSPVACLNYSYFLRELHHRNDFGERELMICDEAHNLESQLQDIVAFTLDPDIGGEIGLEVVDRGEYIEDWEHWIRGPLRSTVQGELDRVEKAIKYEYATKHASEVDKDLLEQRELLEELDADIRHFCSEHDQSIEWVVERRHNEAGELTEVEFTPVSVAPFAERFIFDHADTIVLMSATILDTDLILRSLGLSQYKDRSYQLNIGSSYPAENRPIFYYDTPSVNNGNIDSTFPKICKLIEKIAAEKHAGEPGIIHTVSYGNVERILDNVSSDVRDRCFDHREKDRNQVLRDFKRSDDGILLSPSMYEGVDLEGDLSRWQIIPKIPFLPLGSERVKAKKEQDPAWYDWSTAVRLIQSFGRSVRSPDDHAATYILDGAFSSFWYDRNKRFIPDYVEDSLQNRSIADLM